MAHAIATNERPGQNWILSPIPDLVFIVAAPVLGLVWAGGMFLAFGSTVLIGTVFIFNVAHQLPTFVRIYGDRELLRRYRWSLLLGPVIPFGVALGLVLFLTAYQLPIAHTSALVMMLTFWAPWHLMMQHYGFMRIYDRHNRAPRKIAVRMDLGLCITWFSFVFIAAVPWLPDIVEQLYRNHGIPLVYLMSEKIYLGLEWLALLAALAATVTYFVYVAWCHRKGYFVSIAKLILILVTFAMMYVTFVPNHVLQRVLPGWTFFEGFYAFSMVHNIQYLAIVWKFNRSLANKEQARSGWFRQGFGARGMLVPAVLIAYVVICLVYGALLTNVGRSLYQRVLDPAMVFGLVFAISFTSEILHYYYDGFIWKVRHKENRQHLAMDEKANVESAPPRKVDESWWTNNDTELAASTSLLRQAAYFGPPMAILLVTFALFGQDKRNRAPISFAEHVGRTSGARDDLFRWQRALQSVQRQLEFETRMNGIRSRFRHLAYIAELTYQRAIIRRKLRELGASQGVGSDSHRQQIEQAIEYMKQALLAEPPLKHRESKVLTRQEVQQRIDEWTSQLK